MKPFEIFRAGRHRSMQGEAITFRDAEIAATAAAYDTSIHEAPIVVGHPADDAPAYGWIENLTFADGRLTATPRDVDPAFAELVKAGRFRKVSAAFYKPEAANNPAPGSYALRHVAFLGAVPPAVKGLKAVTFAGDDDQVVAFGQMALFGDDFDRGIVGIFRRLRDWIIDTVNLEKADEVLPQWEIDYLGDRIDAAATETAFAERKEPDMEPNKTAIDTRAAELDAQDEQLKKDQAEFAEQQEKLDADRKAAAEQGRKNAESEAALFVDRLIDAGRVAPGHCDALIAFTSRLDDAEEISFAEDDADAKSSMRSFFHAFLTALPKNISFAEHGADRGDGVDADDPQALAHAGLAYREDMRGKGIDVPIEVAVRKAAEAAAA